MYKETGSSIVSPWDCYNQELAALVHPPDWTNPKPASTYNLVVMGAGTAGLVSAAGAAGLGAKVALIERNLMGGDCLNFGCVPSKALISASRTAAAVRDAGAYGVSVPDGVRVDFAHVMARMRQARSGNNPSRYPFRFGIPMPPASGANFDVTNTTTAIDKAKSAAGSGQ